MSKNNDLFAYSTTERVDSQKVIEAFEDFVEKMRLPQFGFGNRTTLVIVDNAKIHTSAAFKSQLEKWKAQDNLIVCYLPTYSPELNLIEILWGKVKYEWFNLFCIKTFSEFKSELERVFQSFGGEYSITFD